MSTDEYQDLYDREAIAIRVVECFPKEEWQTQPVMENTDGKEES